VGVTTFSKYCRERVNAGPVEYLNHCRLEMAACRLRMERNVPITVIALNSGFNSSQYFATLFVKRYGVSPSQYRLKR
jgi:AraC-like DNA-binding protein